MIAIPLVTGVAGSWIGGTVLGLGTVGAQVGGLVGSYLGARLFAKEGGHESLPKLDSYQTQTTLTGMAIPLIYGTRRIAGNVIYIGDLHPYTVKHKAEGGKGIGGPSVTSTEIRYRRSFLVGICEGPVDTILRIWKGKEEIDITTVDIFIGDGNAGLSVITGLEFGHYKHLCCAWFEEYDLGNYDSIPMFTFEVSRQGVTVNPVDVVYDLLTNSRYAAGISQDLIDVNSYNDIRQYCNNNSLAVAIAIDNQQPLLDWIDNIMSHYFGFLKIG